MSCLTKIAAVITNTCTNVPSAGLKVKAWIFNRGDVTWTVGASATLITAGVNAAGKQAYVMTAVKKEMDAGGEAVVDDNLPGLFKHSVTIQPYERDANSIINIDNMDDIVIVVELQGGLKTADLYTQGKFIILGYDNGLHKVAATWKALDNHGVPTYEFATRDGEEEKYSRYVFWPATDTYAAALDALVVLESIPE